jgi:uncharacterized protein YdeI (YjbR/CyaY-like superfamily)
MTPTDVSFFPTPADFRAWLELHHGTARELWVGYRKKGSGEVSVTWAESVDEALCFGWIDGIRKSLDERSYTNRFTPRKAGSVWSATNIGRVEELTREGRMQPAGLAAFAARRENRSGIYSYEQRSVDLPPELAADLAANSRAAEFFASRPASYRKAAVWWVISAKLETTRRRRLATLVELSAAGERLPQFIPTAQKSS